MEFMKLAIEEAKKSSEDVGCGVIIVKNNEVIAKAFNSQRASFDASAHAEINAIKEAGKKLNNKILEDCTVYCTCEPCIMCLSALSYAKIKKLVYGLNLRDTYPDNRIIDIKIDEFLANSPHKFEVVKNFMENDCKEILQ